MKTILNAQSCIIIIILLLNMQPTQANKSIFVQQKDHLILRLQIGNLKIDLQPILSFNIEKSWVKSDQCKICYLVQNQQPNQQSNREVQSFNQQNYKCQISCFEDNQQAQYGLTCHNKDCKIVKQNIIFQNQASNFKGNQIIIKKIKNYSNKNQYQNFTIILVDRIYKKSTQQKDNQLQLKLKTNFTGQYNIWGQNSVFKDSLMQRNNNKQMQITNIKKGNEQFDKNKYSQVLIVQQNNEADLSINKISLNPLSSLNSASTSSFLELPLSSPLPIVLSLSTFNLKIPQKYFKPLLTFIIDEYFSQQNNQCVYKNVKGWVVQCQKQITVGKVRSLQLSIALGQFQIGFPFSVLITNCKHNLCFLNLQISQAQVFLIGYFIFDIFAITYQQPSSLVLYRLKNQYSLLYQQTQKYEKQNFNIIWWIFLTIFHTILYLIKILFYLALLSLLINCIFQWRKILTWIMKIIHKINKRINKNQKGQLFQQDEDIQIKDTSKLIRTIRNRKFINIQINDQIDDQIV